MDGLTATRRIRGIEGLEDVPDVIVSAHPAEDFYHEAETIGCSDYVTKPDDFLPER